MTNGVTLAYKGNKGRLHFSYPEKPKGKFLTKYMGHSLLPLFYAKNVSFAVASNKRELKQLMTSDVNLVYDKKKGELYDNYNLTERGWDSPGNGDEFDRETVKNYGSDSRLIMRIDTKPKLSHGITAYQESPNNTDEDNSANGNLDNKFKSIDEQILSLENDINLLKSRKGIKGDPGERGEQGIKGEVGATGIQGERGPKGDSGSTDSDEITGINLKISSLEKPSSLIPRFPRHILTPILITISTATMRTSGATIVKLLNSAIGFGQQKQIWCLRIMLS